MAGPSGGAEIKRIGEYEFIFDTTLKATHLFPRRCVLSGGDDNLNKFLREFDHRQYQSAYLKNFQEANGYDDKRMHKFIIDYDNADESRLHEMLSHIPNVLALRCNVIFANGRHEEGVSSSPPLVYLITRRRSTGRYHVHFLNVVFSNKNCLKTVLCELHNLDESVDKIAGVNYFLVLGASKQYKGATKKNKYQPLALAATAAAVDYYQPYKLFIGGRLDECGNVDYLVDVESMNYEDILRLIREVLPDRSSFFECVSLLREISPINDIVIAGKGKTAAAASTPGGNRKRKMNDNARHSTAASDENDQNENNVDRVGRNKKQARPADVCDKKEMKRYLEMRREFLTKFLYSLPLELYADYHGWFNVACTIAGTLGERGRHIFITLSKKDAVKFDYDECNNLFTEILERGAIRTSTGDRVIRSLDTILNPYEGTCASFAKNIETAWRGDRNTFAIAIVKHMLRCKPMFVLDHPQNDRFTLNIAYDPARNLYEKLRDGTLIVRGDGNGEQDGLKRLLYIYRSDIMEMLVYCASKNINNAFLFMHYSKFLSEMDSRAQNIESMIRYVPVDGDQALTYCKLYLVERLITMNYLLRNKLVVVVGDGRRRESDDGGGRDDSKMITAAERWRRLTSPRNLSRGLSTADGVFDVRSAIYQGMMKHQRYTAEHIEHLNALIEQYS